jgi:hypothetical protein
MISITVFALREKNSLIASLGTPSPGGQCVKNPQEMRRQAVLPTYQLGVKCDTIDRWSGT